MCESGKLPARKRKGGALATSSGRASDFRNVLSSLLYAHIVPIVLSNILYAAAAMAVLERRANCVNSTATVGLPSCLRQR